MSEKLRSKINILSFKVQHGIQNVSLKIHTLLSDHTCKSTCDDKLCSLLEETSGLKLCAEEYRVMLHPAL